MSAHMVSKRHVDTLVHCALTGPSDAHGWLGESFSWYHDDRRHELSLHAEVGEERSAAIDGFSGIELVPPSQLGQLLVNECVASVHGRYPDTDPDTGDLPGPCDAYYMGPYVFEPTASPKTSVNAPVALSAVQVAQGIFYFEYQSCENSGWKESEAFAFCQAMKDQILRTLPGAANAPWGWG